MEFVESVSVSLQENEGKTRGDLFMDSQEMYEKGGISKPGMWAFGSLSHSKVCVVETDIIFLPHLSLL